MPAASVNRHGMAIVATRRAMSDPDDAVDYWMSRPIEERVEAVDEIRREYHGWSAANEPKLRRILRVSRPA